jgi:hypothetical protein
MKSGLDGPVGTTVPDYAESLDERFAQQLKKVLHSKTFSGAATLRRILDYMGTRTLAGVGSELKEYTIGVEALDRREDFDPKIDTSVRVQIHRLREKLSRYYQEEGVDDDVLIRIPRGQYSLEFVIAERPRVEVHDGPPAGPSLASVRSDTVTSRASSRPIWTGVMLLSALIVGVLSGFLLDRHFERPQPAAIDPTVASLWISFLGNDKEPIIGFTDAIFLIDESNDLIRFRTGATSERGSEVEPHLAEQFASNPDMAKRAGPLYYEDGYTGTGEVESAANLSALFHDLGVRPQIKRSRDVTIEDLRSHNIVLLGSSFQNKAVDDLPRQGDFHFVKAGLRHELWGGAISNTNPRPGEAALYRTERDETTKALRVDYAMVSFQPGLTPERHIVILGGLDTTGTLGATQFATSAQGASLLLKAGSSVQRGNHKGEPIVQTIVRCTLKDGNSIFDVKAVASHSTEWSERLK